MQKSRSSELILDVSNKILTFYRIELEFSELRLVDIFAGKNNRTLAETLTHHRYQLLWPLIRDMYPTSLEMPLGTFLIGLKRSGDQTYKCHVNALIAAQPLTISCYVCPIAIDCEIDEYERLLTSMLNPDWNIALK